MPLLPELAFTHHDAKLLSDIWQGGGIGPLTPGALSLSDVEVYKCALLQPGAATAILNYYRALLAVDVGLLTCKPEVSSAGGSAAGNPGTRWKE